MKNVFFSSPMYILHFILLAIVALDMQRKSATGRNAVIRLKWNPKFPSERKLWNKQKRLSL